MIAQETISDADLTRPIVLTIRTLPGADDPAPRLRRLLKAMLRGYGFRCERIEVQDDTSEN